MINKEELKKIAYLARIPLKEDELKRLSEDVSEILRYVEKLKELSIEEEFSPQITPQERDTPSFEWNDFSQEELVENFFEKEGRYLKIKRIIEHEF